MKQFLGLFFVWLVLSTSLMAQSEFHPRPETVLSKGHLFSVQHESDREVKFLVAYNSQIYMCRHLHYGEGQKNAIACAKSRSVTEQYFTD
jgi:hypothetical protein